MAYAAWALTWTNGGTLRSDVTMKAGVYFETPSSNPPTVTHLARFRNTGNSGTHTLSLYRYVDGTEANDVLIATVSVDLTTGSAGEFVYAAITPVTLAATTTYYVTSSETSGQDEWRDRWTGGSSPYTTLDTFTSGVGTIQGPMWVDSSNGRHFEGVNQRVYGPVNFKVAVADTAGPNYPSVGESATSGDANEVTWTTPENIQDADVDEATVTAATFDSPDPTFYLVGRGYGFAIPAGSTINGIEVTVNRRSIITSSGIDREIRLRDSGGALIGDDKHDAVTVWPATAADKVYGGPGDTWNTGLSAANLLAMVNSAAFGVSFQAQANIANADIGVAYVTVKVYYYPPAAAIVARRSEGDRAGSRS